MLGVFGDSITHGLYATHVTKAYPVLLAEAKNWSVVNYGYAGRTVEATDAHTVRGDALGAGTVRAKALDVLVLAIGSNDFNHPLGGGATDLALYQMRYAAWISDFRHGPASGPNPYAETPILCITPVPRGDECCENACERNLEDYRAGIRAAIESLDDANVYLFEGRDLLGPSPSNFDGDGLHPNDAGFLEYATNLAALNLIRNSGFELKPRECPGCDPAPSCPTPPAEVSADHPYLWDKLTPIPSLVTSIHHDGARGLCLPGLASRGQLVYGLSAYDEYTLSVWGMEEPGANARIFLEFLDSTAQVINGATVSASITAASPAWGQVTITGSAPANAIRARVRLRNLGTGNAYLDDVELTLAQLSNL